METLWQDLRYSLRTMLKSPVFTMIAMATLALGIGANTVIFSAMNTMVLNPIDFPELDRMVQLWEVPTRRPFNNEFAPALYYDVKRQNTVFEDVAVYRHAVYNLTGEGEPQRLMGARVTASFFPLLRVKPELGRAFTAQEEQPGQDRVVMLSHGYWRSQFAGDPRAVGRTITLDGQNAEIIGVTPESFSLPHIGGAQVFRPFALTPEQAAQRNSHWIYVLGRLKAGIPVNQAQVEMTTLITRLAKEYPAHTDENIKVVPLREEVASHGAEVFPLLMGAVGFVLLIACANVANLLLARAASREKEIATRTALGATRLQITRQLLMESLALATGGGVLGVLLALWGVELLSSGIPEFARNFLPHRGQFSLDATVLGFCSLIVLFSGILFGLAPVLHAWGTDLREALQEGSSRTAGGRGRSRLRSALVVSEVALALVLLAGAGLMIRSFVALQEVNPGFDGHNLLTLEIDVPSAKYPQPENVVQFYQQVQQKLASLPGVVSASAITNLPFGGSNQSTGIRRAEAPEPSPGQGLGARIRAVLPGYFETMAIPVRKGRTFNDRDTATSPQVIILSEELARVLFENEEPIGRHVIAGGGRTPYEVVGIVGNTLHAQLSEEPQRHMYIPETQWANTGMYLVLRTAGEPMLLANAVRQAVWAVDKNQPVSNMQTMEERLGLALSIHRMSMYFLGVFAGVALLMATIGLYGVVSYGVAQRTHEIGIRLALGAQAGDVMRLILGQGARMTMIGVLLGIVIGVGLTRAMGSLLFGIKPGDPLTFGVVALLLVVAALAACWIPARRAARVDPIVALRYE